MTTASTVSGIDNSGLIQNYINKYQTSATTDSTLSSSTQTSITSVTGDFNTFLKILTTQLQNQDPMSATDPNEFTRELVQFSGVEQQINTNAKLDAIISSLTSNGITPLLGYVGQTVEAEANNKIVVQNGLGAFAYTLPGTAQKVTITVTDSNGDTVATMDGSTKSGVNRVAWDGTKDDGTAAANGTYTIKVAATDSNGKSLTVSDTRMIGAVTSIQTDSDGTTTLLVGDVSLKTSDITSVYGSISASSNSSNSSTSG